MKLRSRLLIGAVTVFAAGVPQLAFAQDAAAPAAEDDSSEEVIVTATKRARNVQDVPIAIDVVSQEKLEKTGTTDLLALAQKVPGVAVRTGNAGTVIRIRGIGSGPFGNAEQSVAIYKDGIFIGKSRQNQMPFYDVMRVEILRGPQGALIGKNSSVGALNILSNLPTDEFEGGVTGNYLFDYDGVDIAGYVSGPISESLGGRVALKYRNTTGQLTNFVTGKDEPEVESIQGRATLRFRPSENVDMITKFEYSSVVGDGHNFFGVPLTFTTYQSALDAILNAGGYSAPGISIPGPNGTTISRSDGDSLEQYEFSNSLTVDMDGGLTFVAVSGFISYNSYMSTAGRHAAPFEILNTSYFEDLKQFSQEFRLQSPVSDTFDWVVGVYADYSQFEMLNPLIFDTRNAVGAVTTRGVQHTDLDMDTTSFSIFGTGTWHITPDLDLIVGGRYTSVHKEGELRYISDYLSAGAFTTQPFFFAGSFTDNHFDPSVTLQYDITPEIMVYANYGQGSKPGTFQSGRTTTASDFRLKQEVTTSYEVGLKSKLGGFMTLNASAFYMEMEDFQVGQYITDSNGLPALRSTNAATAISQGVEFSATANLDEWISGLTLSANGAYTDAFYDDYPGATCTVPAIAQGCVNGRPFNGQPSFNGAGLPMQLVSKWTGTVGFDYFRELSDSIGLEFSGSVDMYTSYYFDTSAYSDATGLQKGGAIYNLRLGITDLDGKWGVALIGENLGEVWRGGQSYTYPGFPGTVRTYGIYGGRNLMLQASLKF